MDKLAALNRLNQHESVDLGVVFECAMDNAGFDGRHLSSLSAEELGDVFYHADMILDGNQTGMSLEALALARKVFLGA